MAAAVKFSDEFALLLDVPLALRDVLLGESQMLLQHPAIYRGTVSANAGKRQRLGNRTAVG